MRAALRRLRNGIYIAEDFLWMTTERGRRRPLKIRVRIKINRQSAEVDFSGIGSAVRGKCKRRRSHRSVRGLLRVSLPADRGCARDLRTDPSHSRHCAAQEQL